MRIIILVALCLCVAAKPRTGRDWGKMSDKDWERIEKEWETPEEAEEYEFKPPKQKGVDIEALQKAMKKKGKKGKKGAQNPDVQKIIADSQQSAGPAMMFATLDYEGCCQKNKTEKIATQWGALMQSSGMEVSTYVIEDDQVLFSTQAGGHASEIRDYVVQQTECVAVEWNSQRTPGPAETEEWIAKNEVKKAEKKAAADAKKAEEEAVKKAEEKAAKRRKRAKKAKKQAKDEV